MRQMTSTKKISAMFFGVIVLWAGFWGAVIWIAWHFISKFW